MTLQTVLALRAEGLEGLAKRLGLQVRRHPEHPELVLLKYSMTDSPMADPIARQCRGLIVDAADDWRPVAYPYEKFFNHHEGHCAPIDWSTATVTEKADGILCTLYHARGRWRVATVTSPDGGGLLRGDGRSIEAAFWAVFEARGYRTPARTEHNFFFELCLPTDPVLVRHEAPRLLLHGARDMVSLAEFATDVLAVEHGWERVAASPARSLDEVVRAARALRPTAHEGFVVCDARFHRAKVKSPAYVALHHMKGSLNLRHLLEVVRANEGDEFLAYFPEARGAWEAVRARYSGLRDEAQAALDRGRDLPDDRAFGLSVRDLPYASMLFTVRKGRAASVAEALASMSIQALEKLIGLGALSRTLGVPVEPYARGPVDDG